MTFLLLQFLLDIFMSTSPCSTLLFREHISLQMFDYLRRRASHSPTLILWKHWWESRGSLSSIQRRMAIFCGSFCTQHINEPFSSKNHLKFYLNNPTSLWLLLTQMWFLAAVKIKKLKTDNKIFKARVGMTLSDFQELLQDVSGAYSQRTKSRKQRKWVWSKPQLLPVEMMLIMAFFWLQDNPKMILPLAHFHFQPWILITFLQSVKIKMPKINFTKRQPPIKCCINWFTDGTFFVTQSVNSTSGGGWYLTQKMYFDTKNG